MSSELERELRVLLDTGGLKERPVVLDLEQVAVLEARAQREVDRLLNDTPVRRTKRSLRGILMGAVAAAVAAVVLIVASPGGGPQVALAGFQRPTAFEGISLGHLPSNRVPAREVLTRLASMTDTQVMDGQGDIHFVRSVLWSGAHGEREGSPTALSLFWAVDRSSYLMPEGRMRAIEHKGKAYTPYGELAEELGPFEGAPSTADESYDADSLVRKGPDTYSTDPDELIANTKRGCPFASAFCVYNAMQTMHMSFAVPPALQATFLRALAKTSGVWSLGQVVDRLGRTVEVIEVEGIQEEFREIAFFAPDTGQFLGIETILVRAPDDVDAPVPSLWSANLLVESRMVTRDELPELPSYHKAYDFDD